ncbi:hypothetical protein MRB53_041096 [Persea americana]|nr:hypothetical protein MRB53_041096 [Persea americana]
MLSKPILNVRYEKMPPNCLTLPIPVCSAHEQGRAPLFCSCPPCLPKRRFQRRSRLCTNALLVFVMVELAVAEWAVASAITPASVEDLAGDVVHELWSSLCQSGGKPGGGPSLEGINDELLGDSMILFSVCPPPDPDDYTIVPDFYQSIAACCPQARGLLLSIGGLGWESIWRHGRLRPDSGCRLCRTRLSIGIWYRGKAFTSPPGPHVARCCSTRSRRRAVLADLPLRNDAREYRLFHSCSATEEQHSLTNHHESPGFLVYSSMWWQNDITEPRFSLTSNAPQRYFWPVTKSLLLKLIDGTESAEFPKPIRHLNSRRWHFCLHQSTAAGPQDMSLIDIDQHTTRLSTNLAKPKHRTRPQNGHLLHTNSCWAHCITELIFYICKTFVRPQFRRLNRPGVAKLASRPVIASSSTPSSCCSSRPPATPAWHCSTSPSSKSPSQTPAPPASQRLGAKEGQAMWPCQRDALYEWTSAAATGHVGLWSLVQIAMIRKIVVSCLAAVAWHLFATYFKLGKTSSTSSAVLPPPARREESDTKVEEQVSEQR